MPNHIKNKIELLGELSDLDSMIKTFGTIVKSSLRRTYDDKKVICITNNNRYDVCWLDLATGISESRSLPDMHGIPEGFEPEIQESYLAFPDFTKIIPPPDTDAYHDRPSQKEAEKDPTWWYKWNIANWGTKWSGYAYERPAINIFTFETAWSSVPTVIDVLSKANPKVTIKYSWADEDTGYNCGRAVYHNGLIEQSAPEGGTKEAYELAFELRPDRAEYYEFVEGKYHHKESEE